MVIEFSIDKILLFVIKGTPSFAAKKIFLSFFNTFLPFVITMGVLKGGAIRTLLTLRPDLPFLVCIVTNLSPFLTITGRLPFRVP